MKREIKQKKQRTNNEKEAKKIKSNNFSERNKEMCSRIHRVLRY